MDRHAAGWANRLVGNPEGAAVLEFLMQGAELRILADCRVAVTGADAGTEVEAWHAADLRAGDRISWRRARRGVWSYVAVAGGLEVPRFFGSASVDPRAGIGRVVVAGDVFRSAGSVALDERTAGAWAWWEERRDYGEPPEIGVWPGPQWDEFSDEARTIFFETQWSVSSRSDRVGYRLDGGRVEPPGREMVSEPVRVGSIQVPPNGQPIVTMRDGPTVGGYPKIGWVEAASLDWLVQCGPGRKVKFSHAEAQRRRA
jgi:biotin-dependent carboxylase-like uncharacterized protein